MPESAPVETHRIRIEYEIQVPDAVAKRPPPDPQAADKFVERAIERILRKRGRV